MSRTELRAQAAAYHEERDKKTTRARGDWMRCCCALLPCSDTLLSHLAQILRTYSRRDRSGQKSTRNVNDAVAQITNLVLLVLNGSLHRCVQLPVNRCVKLPVKALTSVKPNSKAADSRLTHCYHIE
eukprot:scaffold74700_cov60-Phaeocystis_antarctica.AAC.8